MSSMNSIRLRELIRSVRKCSNASEERALINRQSAIIRNNFKDAPPTERNRYVLMLLYIRMLGYPTDFSQVEVVNLIGRPELSGKRIGYLALQIMLEETDEVLTLVVNHMKMDFQSSQPMAQAMALNAAANIASEDMSQNIVDDLLKLIKDCHVTTRSKAALAAVRVVRRVPSYAEYFLEQFTDLFRERDPTALLSALTLVNVCLSPPSTSLTSSSAAMSASAADTVPAYVTKYLPIYRKLVGAAARTLKSLVLSTRATESDVSGITDPFMQVKILEFMRLVGRGSAVTAEVLNDVLTQVITATDAKRSVGCTIQYACVQTVDAMESDTSLRMLAVNTCTRFLTARDNNLRFVALQVLSRYARDQVELVQEHQHVILDCLKDVDVSIRRRALELTVMLVTAHNVRLLVPDLLAYLDFCAAEIQAEVVGHICRILEEKAPSEEWQVEYSLTLLRRGGAHVALGFTTRLLALLSRQPVEVQTRAVHVLWDAVCATTPAAAAGASSNSTALCPSPSQPLSMMLAALWMLGEYADYLMTPSGGGAAAAAVADISTVVDEVGRMTLQSATMLVKQYGLTALMKMGSRFVATRAAVVTFLRTCTTSVNCELQQRACEYVALLTDYPAEAEFSFARMPAVDGGHASGDRAQEVRVGTRGRNTEGARQQEEDADSTGKRTGSGVGNNNNNNNNNNSNSSSHHGPSKEEQQQSGAMALRDLFGPVEDDGRRDEPTRAGHLGGEAAAHESWATGMPTATATATEARPRAVVDHLDALFGGAGTEAKPVPPAGGAAAAPSDAWASDPSPSVKHTEYADDQDAFSLGFGGNAAAHGSVSSNAPLVGAALHRDAAEGATPPAWHHSEVAPAPPREVYRCDTFFVEMDARLNGRSIDATLTIHSLLPATDMEQIVLQAAVPRLCRVTLAPLYSTTLVAQGRLLQRMQIDTSNDPKHARDVVLRVKLTYVTCGVPHETLFTISRSL